MALGPGRFGLPWFKGYISKVFTIIWPVLFNKLATKGRLSSWNSQITLLNVHFGYLATKGNVARAVAIYVPGITVMSYNHTLVV